MHVPDHSLIASIGFFGNLNAPMPPPRRIGARRRSSSASAVGSSSVVSFTSATSAPRQTCDLLSHFVRVISAGAIECLDDPGQLSVRRGINLHHDFPVDDERPSNVVEGKRYGFVIWSYANEQWLPLMGCLRQVDPFSKQRHARRLSLASVAHPMWIVDSGTERESIRVF